MNTGGINSSTYREGETLYGIEVRESGAGVLVELWGEFDLFTLGNLRETLNIVLDLRRPIFVDLSGITFLDLDSARELAVRAQLYTTYLFLRDPSPWVTASFEAFGLGGWIPFHPGADHEEPPLVSETSR
jgi:anti-anti-sigma regulatory factor